MWRSDVLSARDFRLALAFALGGRRGDRGRFRAHLFPGFAPRHQPGQRHSRRRSADERRGGRRHACGRRSPRDMTRDIRRVDYLALFDAHGALVVGNVVRACRRFRSTASRISPLPRLLSTPTPARNGAVRRAPPPRRRRAGARARPRRSLRPRKRLAASDGDGADADDRADPRHRRLLRPPRLAATAPRPRHDRGDHGGRPQLAPAGLARERRDRPGRAAPSI